MSFPTQTPEYVDFFEELPAEEVVAPSTEPVTEVPTNSEVATPEAPAPVETPSTEEQLIPKSRFDEVYAKSKENERQLDEVKAALAKIEESKTAVPDPVDETLELEPEAQKAIEKLLASKGFMSKEEFESQQRLETAKVQFQSDVRELSGWAETQGYPKFDPESVNQYAKENGIEVSSKAALKATYLAQNQEAIIQAAIKRGATAAEAPKATVEKPGAGSGKAPSAPDSGNKTIQSRIGEVLQGMGISG